MIRYVMRQIEMASRSPNFDGDAALAIFRNAVADARGTPVYDETGQREIGTVERVSVGKGQYGSLQVTLSVRMHETKGEEMDDDPARHSG